MNTIRGLYALCKVTLEHMLPSFCVRALHAHKTGIKYIISGGTAAVVDLGLLYIFTDIVGLWYLLAAVIAFVFGLFTSFSMHKFWTFRESSLHRLKKQFVFFTSLALVNLILNTFLMYIAVEMLGIWYLGAQFVIMGLLAVMNFVINKTVTFRPDNQDNKNILLATGIYPPDIGGPATYTKTLCEELPRFGWEVKVVTYSDVDKISNIKYQISNKFQNPIHQLADQIQIYRISRQQSKFLRYFKYFWQVLKLLNWANIVYVQGPVSEGLPVYLACKLRGRKYILKVVGDYAWEQMQVGRDVALPRLRAGAEHFITPDEFQSKKFDKSTEKKRKVEYKVALAAEKVIVPSDYLKKIVRQWGVAEDKITVIYNAVELKDVRAVDKLAGEKWLVSVGRLVPWKGMDTLIELMPEILQEVPNAKLHILGDGPVYESLRAKRDELKLGNVVELQGHLPHNDVAAFLAAADTFILNSAYEGLSHVLLEAIAAGAPVVVSNAGGNPEVIKRAGRGHVVPYNDREQLKNSMLIALNEERRAPSEDFLRTFDRDTMIEKTTEVLNS